MNPMDQRPQQPPLPPAPPPSSTGVERCYRHPDQLTRVHCTRCNRPICPECMVPAPVGHQCPECVREARQEFRRSPASRVTSGTRGASVTQLLIVALFAMFAVEVAVGGPGALLTGPSGVSMINLGASIGVTRLDSGFVGIAVGQYWRLITSMFLHFGLVHIGFNAYALWLFGRVVERDYGKMRFTLIYFVGGFVASAASYAFGPFNAVGAGASGAVFAVFGAFVAYNYRRRHAALAAQNLRTAVMLIVLNLGLAFWIPGIDWRAHAGGLIAGILAGAIADQDRARRLATAAQVAGFAVIALAGVALVAVRTAQLHSLFPFLS
jgi:membrane associated rhomboid family serine protease